MRGHQAPSCDLQAMLGDGRAGEVAETLLDLCWSTRHDDEAERILVGLLCLGRLEEVCEHLGALGADAPLLVRLLCADSAVRTSPDADLDLTALSFELIRSDAPSAWTLWYAAIVAKHIGLEGGSKLDAVATMAVRFDDTASNPLETLALGRLKRAIGLKMFMSPHRDDHTRGLARLCAAQTDFAAVGSYEERTWTTALRVYVQATLRDCDPIEAADALERLAVRLETLGSDRAGAARRMALAAAISSRDEARAAKALHAPVVDSEATEMGTSDPQAALVELLADAPDPDALVALRTAGTGTLGWPLAQQAAVLLLDLGAGELAATILSGGAEEPGDPDEIEAGIRIRLQAGEPDAFADLMSFASAWDVGGRSRRAALAELRGARDCDVSGRSPHAETLRLRARRRVRHGRILGPIRLASSWDAARPALPVPTEQDTGANELLVLQGGVQLTRNGEVVPLTPRMAHLLALLVAARRPLTTDAMLEALWPDTSPGVGGNRLKVLLHRLRTRAGLATDQLVVRNRAGFALDTDGTWRIDSWDFWELASGTAEDQLAALDMHAADFCAAVDFDDEVITAERDALRARWVDLACCLASAGVVEIPHVTQLAETLGLDFARLVTEPIAS